MVYFLILLNFFYYILVLMKCNHVLLCTPEYIILEVVFLETTTQRQRVTRTAEVVRHQMVDRCARVEVANTTSSRVSPLDPATLTKTKTLAGEAKKHPFRPLPLEYVVCRCVGV